MIKRNLPVDNEIIRIQKTPDVKRSENSDEESDRLNDNRPHHVFVEDFVTLAARRLQHDPFFCPLSAERERRETIRHQIKPEELNRQERRKRRPHNHGRDEDDEDLAYVAGKEEAYNLANVRIDDAPFLNGVDDRAEIVIGQDHVGGALGDIRPRNAHSDTDVGTL